MAAVRRVRLASLRHSLLPCSVPHLHARLDARFASQSRPKLPSLAIPLRTRSYATEQHWVRSGLGLGLRWGAALWGLMACFGLLSALLVEDKSERDYPTPHEWTFFTRKALRDAHKGSSPKDGISQWVAAMAQARECVSRLENPKTDGSNVVKLGDATDPDDLFPGEFNPCDITGKSEAWRRGYFEASMIIAKAAENLHDWVLDPATKVVVAPEYVIGSSNPSPKPMPANKRNQRAPREEDCVIAFPDADKFYLKILATKGFNTRQRLEALLEYASFLIFMKRSEEADDVHKLALAEATQGSNPSRPPYNPKTYVLNEDAGPPSLNLLDAITAVATRKARSGDTAAALPIYLSLLKARRFLPAEPPGGAVKPPAAKNPLDQLMTYVGQSDYPLPPPDGTSPPWRSPEERCREASLSLWIGEILFTSSSRHDGLSWTRDSVDVAEEHLRAIGPFPEDKETQTTCRECLAAGLENWGKMVAKLAKEDERRREEAANRSSVFSFWSGSQPAEGRWEAETAVVEERVRRTHELLIDDVRGPSGWVNIFRA